MITDLEELERRLVLTDAEKGFRQQKNAVPISITEHFFSLIDPNDPNDPIRRQVVPQVYELEDMILETPDPLEEVKHSINSRLVHRYANRVAFLTTDICPMYCRHCFRRRFTGKMQGPATDDDIIQSAKYIHDNPQITEILLTGGDMLTLSDERIRFMVKTFREASPHLVMRICTRMPITYPERVTDELVDMFMQFDTAPFYLMLQINHPRELCEKSVKAVKKFTSRGIMALNQSVLLRGVNDNVDTMEQLCRKLIASGIKPYYVFQGDLVEGTSHLRVPLARTIEIEKELRRRVSGIEMPTFAMDLPKGGGKIPVSGTYIKGCRDGIWEVETLDGDVRYYPDPVIKEN